MVTTGAALPLRNLLPLSAAQVTQVLALTTFLAASLAAVYAYRKQRIEEASSQRADDARLLDRYGEAAGQMGHERATVRLAGAYALISLAEDWPTERQNCLNLLCAYLRMPPKGETPQEEAEDHEVRQSIVRALSDKIRAVPEVVLSIAARR
jgi:hypothetical protein